MNDTTITFTRLLTDKLALNHSRIDQQSIPLPLEQREALLKIRRVAITTNNITYAAFGDAMQYWGFFPTGEDNWGHMPVWGFADVVASSVSGVEVGERFYGYFPIASHLRVVPERVTPRGFYDGAEHRKALASAYNQYTRCSHDRRIARARKPPDARAAVVHHVVHAGRLPAGQRVLRRAATRGFERIEQDGVRHCVLLAGSAQCRVDRAHVEAKSRVCRRARLLSADRYLRHARGDGAATCPRCMSTSPATSCCASVCTVTSPTRSCTTATRVRRRTRISYATPGCRGRAPKF